MLNMYRNYLAPINVHISIYFRITLERRNQKYKSYGYCLQSPVF
jgi:hypothetical protein